MEKLIGLNLANKVADLVTMAFENMGSYDSKVTIGNEMSSWFDNEDHYDFELDNIYDGDTYRFISNCLNEEFLDLDFIKLDSVEVMDYDGDMEIARVYTSIGFTPKEGGFGSGFTHDSFIWFSYRVATFDEFELEDIRVDLKETWGDLDDIYMSTHNNELESLIKRIKGAFTNGTNDEACQELVDLLEGAIGEINDAYDKISSAMDSIQESIDQIEDILG